MWKVAITGNGRNIHLYRIIDAQQKLSTINRHLELTNRKQLSLDEFLNKVESTRLTTVMNFDDALTFEYEKMMREIS